MNLDQLLAKPESVIVDVRTPAEFSEGNVPGSMNIPMDEVPARLEEFRSFDGPVVLCCASGNRSGNVARYLTGLGLNNVVNGGGWLEVLPYVNPQKS